MLYETRELVVYSKQIGEWARAAPWRFCFLNCSLTLCGWSTQIGCIRRRWQNMQRLHLDSSALWRFMDYWTSPTSVHLPFCPSFTDSFWQFRWPFVVRLSNEGRSAVLVRWMQMFGTLIKGIKFVNREVPGELRNSHAAISYNCLISQMRKHKGTTFEWTKYFFNINILVHSNASIWMC